MDALAEALNRRGVEPDSVKQALKEFVLETGSWAYADSGTRFKVFAQPSAARNVLEKIEDAACVHRVTGAAPTVAVHVLWDFVTHTVDEALAHAESLGVRIGAVNPTLFEQDEYMLGSLANPDEAIRDKALAHVFDSIDIMRKCGSRDLSLWLADGTNYPGQDDLRARKHRLTESLRKVHDALDDEMRLLLEYKVFEPAFYSTDIGDWGTAFVLAKHCGPRAKVLVDLGHHPLGTNVEQIVAFLIDEDMLGGFHFNSKKYADDDLTAGSMAPYELFLVFNELVAAGGARLYDTAYMMDQSHNIKPKIEAMVQTVMVLQETCAKALTVDRAALADAQKRGNVIDAERLLKEAFFTDVGPLVEAVRQEMGGAPDPLRAYRESGYQERIAGGRS
jgi:L-rhamnose isomerase/sugar isomerase